MHMGLSPFASLRDMFRERVFAVHDHCERLAVVSLLERRRPADQHVQDHAQ